MMIAPLQIGLQLIDWTDPLKAVYVRPCFAAALVLTSSPDAVKPITSNLTI